MDLTVEPPSLRTRSAMGSLMAKKKTIGEVAAGRAAIKGLHSVAFGLPRATSRFVSEHSTSVFEAPGSSVLCGWSD
jgi:hypothetical protein